MQALATMAIPALAGALMPKKSAPQQKTPEAPVQEMPVAGDEASLAARRNRIKSEAMRGGRASTIITGSRLGD